MTPTNAAPVTVEEGPPCPNCLKPVQAGQVVLPWDDAGEMHADCERPYRTDHTQQPNCPAPCVLIGDPMRLVPLAALASAPACAASPDHADIMETIENAGDDWQKQGYPTALAEVRDMANVGRSLLERIADHSSEGPLKGWRPADCPTEVVCDLLNMLADASAPTGDHVPDARRMIAPAGDGVEAVTRMLRDCASDLTSTASHHGQYAAIDQDKIDGLRDAVRDYDEALARPRAAVGEREA